MNKENFITKKIQLNKKTNFKNKIQTFYNHVITRCEEEQIKPSNECILFFNKSDIKKNNPLFFELNYRVYDYFSGKKCDKCGNLDSIKNISFKINNNLDNIIDCEYCLDKFTSHCKQKLSVGQQINVELLTNMDTASSYGEEYLKSGILFKKAFEHYISGKTLIKNKKTIEQGVVNFSECLEKILKGYILINKLEPDQDHNIEKTYLLLRDTKFKTPYLNLKLIKSLRDSYKILRYKEGNLKTGMHLIINASLIEKEMDYTIYSFKKVLFPQKPTKEYNIQTIWEHTVAIGDLFEELKKRNSHDNCFLMRENRFIKNNERPFFIEHNYLTHYNNQEFLIYNIDNLSYNDSLKTVYNSYDILSYINNDLYIKK